MMALLKLVFYLLINEAKSGDYSLFFLQLKCFGKKDINEFNEMKTEHPSQGRGENATMAAWWIPDPLGLVSWQEGPEGRVSLQASTALHQGGGSRLESEAPQTTSKVSYKGLPIKCCG